MTDWATYASHRRRQTPPGTDDRQRSPDGEASDAPPVPTTEGAPSRSTAASRVLGWLAWLISAAQYLLPAVLTPVGGLTGLAYADVRGAIVGALIGLLLALVLMPVARWAGWLGVRIVAGVLGGARRHLFVFALVVLGLSLLVLELRT